LDNFLNSVGFMAVGSGYIKFIRRFHTHPIGDCNCRGFDSHNSRAHTSLINREGYKSMKGNFNQKDHEIGITEKLVYFLIGGSIGAALALLFAPKTGQELRGDIAGATRKGIDLTRETAIQVKDKAANTIEEARTKASELYSTSVQAANNLSEQAKGVVSEKVGQLNAAVEAGTHAYNDKKAQAKLNV